MCDVACPPQRFKQQGNISHWLGVLNNNIRKDTSKGPHTRALATCSERPLMSKPSVRPLK